MSADFDIATKSKTKSIVLKRRLKNQIIRQRMGRELLKQIPNSLRGREKVPHILSHNALHREAEEDD